MSSEAFSITLLLLLLLGFLALYSPLNHHKVRGNEIQKSTVAFVIDEELPIGARIGSLSEKFDVDLNSVKPGEVNFIPLTDEQLVTFNRTSGLLRVRQRIDRENLCRQTGACCPVQNVIPSTTSTFHDSLFSIMPGVRNPNCAIKLLIMDQRQRSSLDAPSQEHSLINVIIYVNDLNDNSPSWSPDKLELEIPEHTTIGRQFQLPVAIDPDQGPENTVKSYRLIPSDPHTYDPSVRGLGIDAFEFSSKPLEQSPTATADKFSLGLKVKADLDRERQSVYYFILIAVDGGSPQRTGSLSVVVRVTDINDQTPYFRQPNPSIDIPENIAVGTQICIVSAHDNDPSDVNRLEYKMGSTATAEVQRLFSVDSQTGAVFVASDLDYESAPILPTSEGKDSIFGTLSASTEYGYVIPIEVSDRAHIAETKLRVQLVNTNDNPPIISLQSPLQRYASKGGELYIREDAPVGTLVATITMTDADERGIDDGTFQNRASVPYCSTTTPYFTIQPLHAGMRHLFKLVTSKPLDHETKNTHAISIHCHDAGKPPLSATKHLTVRLEDVNDSPPVFEKSVYYARITEGLPVHTPIVKIHANDADKGEMADVRYRFAKRPQSGGYEQLVLLDESTGHIRSGAIFDRETMLSINFTVEAVDCAGGNNTSCEGRLNTAVTEVVVLIEDSNDCIPEFDQQSYEFSVEEGHAAKVAVGRVHASDGDSDLKNSRLRYHINDEGGSTLLDGVRASRLFSITPAGEIYTNSVPIDREQVPILTFSVVATDSGEPPLSAFATVVIRVEDVNDNGPQWIYPLPGSQTACINISAYATVGMVVARLEATDPDIGINGQVEYEIVRGNGQKYFDLDQHSGTLYLTRLLEVSADINSTSDQSTPTSFALSLKATDNGDPARSNTSLLRIFVQTVETFTSNGALSGDGTRSLGKPQQYSANGYFKQHSNFVDRDLLVMIVMIIITLLVSILLIMAIVLLRCRQTQSPREMGGGDPQLGTGGTGCVGMMRVAQIKSPSWLPPPSQDHAAKSGYTMDLSKSGTTAFDRQAHYMTTSGHLLMGDKTQKPFDGISAVGKFGRFSPAAAVSQQLSGTTSTFQSMSNHCDNPSPTGAIVYTSKTLGGRSSPRYLHQVCATLPNNIMAKPVSDSEGRCYMTLNPELYEVDYPYCQFRPHNAAYQHARRLSYPEASEVVKNDRSMINTEHPPSAMGYRVVNEAPPPLETQKRCRFKMDTSGSQPLLTSIVANYNNAEGKEETLDELDDAFQSMPMKRLRNGCESEVPEDTLLVDIQ